jgi:hypothetical protein
MKRQHITLIAILLVVGSVSSAYAVVTHAENTNILGQLTVHNGNLVVQHTDAAPGGFSTRAAGQSNVFQFIETDGGQVYRFVLNGDGSEFSLRDFTSANRADIAIKTATGNVGIGHSSPTEKLDVNGNIKLSGNIKSNGDICIGACP